MEVRELEDEKVGEIARKQSILLHELAPRATSLEDAEQQLTSPR